MGSLSEISENISDIGFPEGLEAQHLPNVVVEKYTVHTKLRGLGLV